MLPAHTADGFLPAGIHSASWEEVVDRLSGSARREALIEGLLAGLTHLAEAGCVRVLLAGSFVTTKQNPKDVDVLWHTAGVDPDLSIRCS
jgi:hypothetical protein